MHERNTDELRESGIKWIGKIPKHWGVTQLKFLSKISGRIGFRGYTTDDIVEEGEGPISLSPSNIKSDQLVLKNNTYLSWDKYYESPEIMVFPKDVVLVKTGSTIGKTAYIPEDVPKMTINPQLIVLKEIKGNPKYLYYQTKCPYIKNTFNVEQAGGSTPSISQEKIKGFSCLDIPTNEQKAIATFLDRKTKAIDELIEKKQQLIEKLKEKRQALITQAVTKGLNPDAPTKESGIEWLGEIPEHWEMVKIKWLFRNITSGSTPTSTNEDYYKGHIPWVQTGDLNDEIIFNTKKKITEKALNDVSALKIFPENTLLMAMYGATIGKLGILKDKSATNQACCAMIDPKCNYWFMFFWLLSMRKEIINLAYGGGQPNISQDVIKNISVTTPPGDEQDRIVEFIKSNHNRTVKSITKVELQIDKLKEYRQSLISAVVTGKIDVRDEVEIQT